MTIANAKLKSNFGKDCHIIHGIYYFLEILTIINLKICVACKTEVDLNGVYPNLFFEIYLKKIKCRLTCSKFTFSFTGN